MGDINEFLKLKKFLIKSREELEKKKIKLIEKNKIQEAELKLKSLNSNVKKSKKKDDDLEPMIITSDSATKDTQNGKLIDGDKVQLTFSRKSNKGIPKKYPFKCAHVKKDGSICEKNSYVKYCGICKNYAEHREECKQLGIPIKEYVSKKKTKQLESNEKPVNNENQQETDHAEDI